MPCNLAGPQRERFCQLAAQRLRQIRHLAKIASPLLKEPTAHLPNTICPLAALPKPPRKQLIDRVQQMNHHQYFAAISFATEITQHTEMKSKLSLPSVNYR